MFLWAREKHSSGYPSVIFDVDPGRPVPQSEDICACLTVHDRAAIRSSLFCPCFSVVETKT